MKQKRNLINLDTGKTNPYVMDKQGKSSRNSKQELLKLKQVNDGSTKERALTAKQILELLKNERSQKGLNTVTEPLYQTL